MQPKACPLSRPQLVELHSWKSRLVRVPEQGLYGHFTNRKREAHNGEGIWPKTQLSSGGAGLDPGSCPCPVQRAAVTGPGATLGVAKPAPGIDPGFAPCFHHYSDFPPKLVCFCSKRDPRYTWKNCLLGWEQRQAAPLLLDCVSGQFFLKEGLVSPRSPGPWQVGVGLAEVSVPPGASGRHISLPAGQPRAPLSGWGWGDPAGEVREEGPTPLLLLSQQGWPYTVLAFRELVAFSGPVSLS